MIPPMKGKAAGTPTAVRPRAAVLAFFVALGAVAPLPVARAQGALPNDVLSARALMRHVAYLAAPALRGRAAGRRCKNSRFGRAPKRGSGSPSPRTCRDPSQALLASRRRAAAIHRTSSLPEVPVLFFGSGESDDYHSPRDTLERLHPEIMERRARALLRVALRLSEAPASTFDVSAHDLPARAHASTYLPIGLGSGVSVHAAGTGAYVGGEASLVRLQHGSLVWTGMYVDSVYDLGTRTTRLGVGPELGLGPLGLDGGLVLEPWSNPVRAGAALRAILTTGYVS